MDTTDLGRKVCAIFVLVSLRLSLLNGTNKPDAPGLDAKSWHVVVFLH
jgi:hypothetical protein